MQIQTISFIPQNQIKQKIFSFQGNQEGNLAVDPKTIPAKNNQKRNSLIALIVATPAVLFGLYQMLKRGKAHEIIETIGTKGTPEFKNPDAERIINEIREKLTTRPNISAEFVDEHVQNGPRKPNAWAFDDMKKYYEELEQQAQAKIKQAAEEARRIAEETRQKGQDLVTSIKALRKKTVVNEDTINNALEARGARKPNAWDPADMKKYYENGCVEEYVENGARIIKYPKTLDGKQTIREIYNDMEVETTTFGKLTEKIVKNKDGKIIQKATIDSSNSRINRTIEEFDPANGNLIKRTITKNGNTNISGYYGDIKTTTYQTNDGKQVTKIYQKENGKYKCIHRETSFPDNPSEPIKVVEQLDNGYSKTTISDKYDTKVTIRDKKGNIVDESVIKKSDGPNGPKGADGSTGKLLAPWYKDYLKLCEKYGQSPRMIGVKGGAWDHYYELCLLRDDPQAYASYIRIQEYRARYDEGARICVAVRNGQIKAGVYENMSAQDQELFWEFKEILKKLPKDEHQYYLEEFEQYGAQDLENIIYKIRNRIQEISSARERQRQIIQIHA